MQVLFALLTLMVAAVPARAAEEMTVRIPFAAQVKGQPFQCERTYTGIGTTQSTLQALDFRFYVSAVHLLTAGGQAVPVKLTPDGQWQQEDVALLDFEDRTGNCTGTPATHTALTGTVPKGNYTALRFDLGIPFAKNHQDVNGAPPPLDLTALFWVWQSGYKFARLDFQSRGLPRGFVVHLGSTGCMGQAPGSPALGKTAPPAACQAPNRATVTLPFVPGQDQVIADLGQLLSTTNVDVNQPKTPAGCMSSPDDQDCGGLFQALGLPFAGQTASEQRFFRTAPQP